MSDINIVTTVAQLPNLQGLAGAQLAHPEAQQVFAAQMTQQMLKDQHDQVQKVDKQEGSDAVDEDKEGRQEARRQASGRRNAPHHQPEPEPEAQPASSSPWLGHLINRKV
ncbi:hypothetical protein NNJEOMEG_00374 [Fundidesulfovibrio magnetotacticus]|uniref:Uncharacterized protein n=1 Tax=Fundidesulfovibrio magnetotacticus TaxID=2730080 RepID=A0A6V8LR00_9BACT|nr:hypothetical protein [Fundidesulfovibrio magnetotacticus]GFK92549.1 hypothetical protein NNJEOMEG_00374 [Fundidesulfovibrio magnetotacticus]